jgi:hypothetical protein
MLKTLIDLAASAPEWDTATCNTNAIIVFVLQTVLPRIATVRFESIENIDCVSVVQTNITQS